MSIRTEAEENLRVIRSLMERATIYRAVSAPGALLGGVLATGVAAVVMARPELIASKTDPMWLFVMIWLGVLLATTVLNFGLIAREAARREEPFVSQGMKLALRAMSPALLGGAVVALQGCSVEQLASLWVLFYGISLLAASHFAPKSICWLGRAFFVAGALATVAYPFRIVRLSADPLANAYLIMGATFGLFHLVYAACTWPRKTASTAAPASS